MFMKRAFSFAAIYLGLFCLAMCAKTQHKVVKSDKLTQQLKKTPAPALKAAEPKVTLPPVKNSNNKITLAAKPAKSVVEAKAEQPKVEPPKEDRKLISLFGSSSSSSSSSAQSGDVQKSINTLMDVFKSVNDLNGSPYFSVGLKVAFKNQSGSSTALSNSSSQGRLLRQEDLKSMLENPDKNVKAEVVPERKLKDKHASKKSKTNGDKKSKTNVDKKSKVNLDKKSKLKAKLAKKLSTKSAKKSHSFKKSHHNKKVKI